MVKKKLPKEKSSAQRGKLIAIYGTNNLGKTYQANRLVEFLSREKGLSAEYLKYPLYNLEPTGSLINSYLRGGNPFSLSGREFQILQVLNRTQFDAELRQKLKDGKTVIVEDYVGTGLAWGIGSGADKEFLVGLNSHLLEEDMAILLDGDRFSDGKEDGHRHEENEELMGQVRKVHLELAGEFGWHKVNANQTRDMVFGEIVDIIEKTL